MIVYFCKHHSTKKLIRDIIIKFKIKNKILDLLYLFIIRSHQTGFRK